MADWNFNDKMSSWYNRRGLDARWYYNAWPQNPPPAICMDPGATGSYNFGDPNKLQDVDALDLHDFDSLLVSQRPPSRRRPGAVSGDSARFLVDEIEGDRGEER